MEKLFLAKIKNSDDRDIVKYIEFSGFECNHYFGGLHIHGACFCGFEKELRDIVENNFDPSKTATHEFYLQISGFKIQAIDVGYFQFSAG